jgi:ADP-heptose:LPS heptosyltransferase
LAALPQVAWHSFQREDCLEAPFSGIHPLGSLLSNFSDTAYALGAMDLVITVDTAVAHLAGAMGIPVLLLVTFIPDWRWMLERDDSPWYPTLRIYRQATPGDWEDVVRRVVTDLEGGA